MRKYVISATTDEFFMADETTLWWDDMPGPKHQLCVSSYTPDNRNDFGGGELGYARDNRPEPQNHTKGSWAHR